MDQIHSIGFTSGDCAAQGNTGTWYPMAVFGNISLLKGPHFLPKEAQRRDCSFASGSIRNGIRVPSDRLQAPFVALSGGGFQES